MKTKIILILGIITALIVLGVIFIPFKQQNPLSNPKSNLNLSPKEIKPSEIYMQYTDPSGFSFSYPDNLSISKAEIEDPNTYTDLQLFSKDVNGSINLKIADSKLKTLDEWLKINKIPPAIAPKEVNLGSLKALEVKLSDRLLLASLDQGVLFTVEMPRVEEDFWMKVYQKLLADFTFTAPEAVSPQGVTDSSSSDITFEGEEVVE